VSEGEGLPAPIFIRPGNGLDREKGVAHEIVELLYGHPRAARALRFTLDSWFKVEGFEHAGLQESVWVLQHTVSTHIYLLCFCKRLSYLQPKRSYLQSFQGTDDKSHRVSIWAANWSGIARLRRSL
jgi:hypothetical protein